MLWSIRLALFSLFIVLAVAHAAGHAQSPAALLQQSANAMGGLGALRALKTQVIESEGKQFDSSSTAQPLGPTRQINTFRYTFTRDLTRPRLRLVWEGQSLGSKQTVRFVETIDGSTGMLQEDGDGTKQTRLHPGLGNAPARGAPQPGKTRPECLEQQDFATPRQHSARRQTSRGVVF
jgi:hypothetical protein